MIERSGFWLARDGRPQIVFMSDNGGNTVLS
jgi:hypothetical protein